MKISFLIIPLVAAIVALSGSFATSRGMDWYDQINLPEWTPSGDIIGIAWTLIFIMAAYSAILFWNKGYRNRKFRITIALFLLNGALNALWSFLFFGLHFVGAAILEMIALEISTVCLLVLVRPTSRLASILLYPYAIWVAFAAYLAYSILMLNL